jgi:hypothetical protein
MQVKDVTINLIGALENYTLGKCNALAKSHGSPDDERRIAINVAKLPGAIDPPFDVGVR